MVLKGTKDIGDHLFFPKILKVDPKSHPDNFTEP